MLMPSGIILPTVAQWLAGAFENRAQSMAEPAWFVHLRMWQRLLPHRLEGHFALFAEQANALFLDKPYRQRVLILQAVDSEHIQVQYLALKQPDQFCGAGAKPELLKQLGWDDLEWLPGCALTLTSQGNSFVAKPQPGDRCYFQYDGKTREVVLGFEVTESTFHSYDRGVDPETGQALWGALMGPYEYVKCEDFAAELPEYSGSHDQ